MRDFIKDYPHLFTQYLPGRGIECGDGWENLIQKLIDLIIEQDSKFSFMQIKEKFGELTIYYEPYDQNGFIDNYINNIRTLSRITCEVCGNKGKMQDVNGWMTVRCEEHD